MKALILAAGYGTRLYPLTLNKPKPLLKVGPKAIIDHILHAISFVKEVNHVLVVTNQKFSGNFEEWARSAETKLAVKVIDDGTLTNETRLGAIGDMRLVIDAEKIKEDILVIAGDNLFDLSLSDFVKFAKSKAGVTVAIRVVNDAEKMKKYGVVQLDDVNRITDFEEKPESPKSNLAAMCVYYFPREKLGMISRYLESGQTNKDAPGYYISWLSKKDAVYGYRFEGEWFDIGDKESYKLADEIYTKRGKKGKRGIKRKNITG